MSVLIISPSGNFYGSEQVLLDYLGSTSIKSRVAVNENGIFLNILRDANTSHTLFGFNPFRLKSFYVGLVKDLFGGKYSTIYWNEAGHINYSILLSKLFPKKKFVVHVRIIEDTATDRWVMRPGKNIEFIAVSEYIRKHLKFPSELIYDPFKFSEGIQPGSDFGNILRIGIVGRLTFTKGINTCSELFRLIESRGLGSQFEFVFFGEVSEDVKNSDWLEKNSRYSFVEFAGFQKDRKFIYDSIDVVLHLSIQEALGRIFLEAINAGKPLIGMNAAGIGEIGNLLGLNDLLIENNNEDIPGKILEKLHYVKSERRELTSRILVAKKKAAEVFSPEQYIGSIDKILSR